MVQAWHFPPGSIEDKRAGDTQLHLPSILLHTLTENIYFTLSLTCFVLTYHFFFILEPACRNFRDVSRPLKN